MGIKFDKKEKYDKYKNYVAQLEGEYKESFCKIESYINTCPKLYYREKNNCLLEVLDCFLTAADSGRNVHEVTGSDLKAFCDGLICGESMRIHKICKICSSLFESILYLSLFCFTLQVIQAITGTGAKVSLTPMKFGLGEVCIIIGYLAIPWIVYISTRNHLENPKLYSRIKNYTSYGLWLLTLFAFSYLKDDTLAAKFSITIPLSTLSLLLIYIALFTAVVRIVAKTVEICTFENKYVKRDEIYFNYLNSNYAMHLAKNATASNNSLTWHKFIQRRTIYNYFSIALFIIFSTCFLALAFLAGKGMIVKNNVSPIGLILLSIISICLIFTICFILEGFRRNKLLAKLYNKFSTD